MTMVYGRNEQRAIIGSAVAPPPLLFYTIQADRAYGMEISPRLFVISFVILSYAISYNICV